MRAFFVCGLAAALACGSSGPTSTSTISPGPGSTGVPPPSAVVHHVTVSVSGTGQVSSGDGRIACPGVCEADFNDGATVSFTASPAVGFDPAAFSGPCNGASCGFVVHEDVRVAAVFPRTQVPVGVQVTGSGTVVSTPPGIVCPGHCSAVFDYGTNVSLFSSPAPGFGTSASVVRCGGGPCDGPLTVPETYAVTFTREFTLSIATSGDGDGRVVSSPGGIDCPGHCSAIFFEGTLVTLAAKPDVDSMVASWSGDCATAPCSLSLHADATAKLVWRPRRYIPTIVSTRSAATASDARAISRDGHYVAGLTGADVVYFSHDGAPLETRVHGDVSGVNGSGTTCGLTSDFHGYTLTSGGVLTDLGAARIATGINDAGTTVGYASFNFSNTHAAYWPLGGDAVDLGALDGQFSVATAINSHGVIVGGSSVTRRPDGQFLEHAVRFRAPNLIDDLGTLGGTSSYASAISENGIIAGTSSLAGDVVSHGFVIGADGHMLDVGVPPGLTSSGLSGVNSQGTAVGTASDGTSLFGIVYRAGRLYRLTDLTVQNGLFVWIPTGIAEDGSIAAYGNDSTGLSRGLRLALEPQ